MLIAIRKSLCHLHVNITVMWVTVSCMHLEAVYCQCYLIYWPAFKMSEVLM